MSDHINTELAKFNFTESKLADLRGEYMPLVVAGPDDGFNYSICKEAHQNVKKKRLEIEAVRKALKADSLEYGRMVDAEAKKWDTGIREIEDHLLTQRKVVEDETKRLAAEKVRLEIEAEEKAKREEEERIEAVRKEQEAKERELKEKEEAIEAKEKAVALATFLLDEERAEVASRKAQEIINKARAEQDEIDRIEREKRHAEEIENAKVEAADQAIKDKEAADMKAADEAERRRVMAPDREKVQRLMYALCEFEMPKVVSPEADAIVSSVQAQLAGLCIYIEQEIEDKL